MFQDILFYVLTLSFLIYFLRVLLSGRRKSKFRFGRKKRVTKILRENINLNLQQKAIISDMIQRLSHEFVRHGEVDYESLIDTIAKIASGDHKYSKVVSILTYVIDKEKPYYRVSEVSESMFMKLDNEIRHGQTNDALADLNVLYKQHVSIERTMKGISIIGFLFTTLSFIIPIIQSFIEYLESLQ